MRMLKGFLFSVVTALVVVAGFTYQADAADPRPLYGSATYDPASLIDAAGASTTVTVQGAALGDFCAASFGVSTAGISVTCNITAANTATVRFQNESAGTLDLASSTLRVIVWRVPAGG
jgi:hypothetical protein